MGEDKVCDDVSEQARSGRVTAPRLHVVLVEPEIAGNTGSIGRTCVAIGARLWLVRPLGFHLDERRIRRAGLDYWDQLDLRIIDTLEDALAAFEPGRFWLFSTHVRKSHDQVAYRAGDALVFGSESRGLPQRLLQSHPERAVRIPMRPAARSLNLATAVAIGAYEAARCSGITRDL